MANKVLSVVVPTYNMEAYLPRCLDSVTREDVPDTLEVIVVNDGSKDRSLKIAQEYQAKRPDIIKVIDKSNGHYGSCINAALKVATGKYFRPLDADDWFDTESLVQMISRLGTTNADMLITPFKVFTKDEIFTIKSEHLIPNQEHTDLQTLNARDMRFFAMHGITYKTDVLKQSDYRQTEGICYTDMEYVLYPQDHVKSFECFNEALYMYDMNREGQSMDPCVFQKGALQFYKIFKRYLENRSSIPKHFYTKLLDFLHPFYFQIIFSKTKENDLYLDKIDKGFIRINKEITKDLDKRLFHLLTLWRLTKIHPWILESMKKSLTHR